MKLNNTLPDRGLTHSHFVELPRESVTLLATASRITSLSTDQLVSGCILKLLQPTPTELLRAEIERSKIYFK
jgi:hypothetical protein